MKRMPRWLAFWRRKDPVVAVLRLGGPIGSMPGFRQGLTLESLAEPLEAAFSSRRTTAVAILLNSPGGAPVQADLIKTRIEALAKEKEKPVFAFCEDLCASGGYWIAQAADEIFAHPASVVGSIGVITAGFGFQEALARLGVERRVHAQGEHKGMLDPFRPERPEDLERLAALQTDLYERFKAVVRARRGTKLKEDRDDLFSGAVWTGGRALELGLVDGLGDLRTVMRDRYGKEVAFRFYGEAKPLWRRLGFAGAAAPDLARSIIAAVEERSMWNRFGL